MSPDVDRDLTPPQSVCCYRRYRQHAVDADSFPLELDSFPKMATLGSYTLGPYRMTYTVEEQKEIVEFARLRGIRIVLELECALVILVPSSLSSGQLDSLS